MWRRCQGTVWRASNAWYQAQASEKWRNTAQERTSCHRPWRTHWRLPTILLFSQHGCTPSTCLVVQDHPSKALTHHPHAPRLILLRPGQQEVLVTTRTSKVEPIVPKQVCHDGDGAGCPHRAKKRGHSRRAMPCRSFGHRSSTTRPPRLPHRRLSGFLPFAFFRRPHPRARPWSA